MHKMFIVVYLNQFIKEQKLVADVLFCSKTEVRGRGDRETEQSTNSARETWNDKPSFSSSVTKSLVTTPEKPLVTLPESLVTSPDMKDVDLDLVEELLGPSISQPKPTTSQPPPARQPAKQNKDKASDSKKARRTSSVASRHSDSILDDDDDEFAFLLDGDDDEEMPTDDSKTNDSLMNDLLDLCAD